jgi:hypothetical protein
LGVSWHKSVIFLGDDLAHFGPDILDTAATLFLFSAWVVSAEVPVLVS